MKFVVFCIVLSTIVSLALTLDCASNTTEVCGDCSPEKRCDTIRVQQRTCLVCFCRCNKGYLKDGGRCVLPKDCPKQ
uniref:Uncharacterized protein LOC114328752 isoform X6 n=1 Tax=Diabrotica virgifera virgifera TaxID=50390 RepID=A0A6P7FCW1_DIAVI